MAEIKILKCKWRKWKYAQTLSLAKLSSIINHFGQAKKLEFNFAKLESLVKSGLVSSFFAHDPT